MAHAGQVRYAIWLEPETMVARAVVAFKFNFKVGASGARSGQVRFITRPKSRTMMAKRKKKPPKSQQFQP